MTASIEQLVARLEAIDLEPQLADPEATQLLMSERTELLAALHTLTRAELEPVRARLLAVQQREERWKIALLKLREEAHQAIVKADGGRRALSGYKKTVSEAPTHVRRSL